MLRAIIPNGIEILTNLQKLDLYNTGLIGSIPTEIGLLTKLTSLRLGKRLFSVLLLCFEMKHIHLFFASNLFSLFFSHILIA